MKISVLSLALPIAMAAPILNPVVEQPSDLPDLVVTEVTVNDECHVVVTVRNQGSGSVKDSYPPPDIAVQFVVGDSGAGGWGLSLASIAAIRPPGGSATQTFPKLIEGGVGLTTIVDSLNKVVESNESNNSLTRNLGCEQPFPDLAISDIHFAGDCRPIVSLANVGDGPLPEQAYYSSPHTDAYYLAIERSFDGAVSHASDLVKFDPTRKMKPPGGSIEFEDSTGLRAGEQVRYEWKWGFGKPPFWHEKSTNVANNVREITVPARCQADLAVTDLRLDGQCHILATVRNAGTGALPTKAFYVPPSLTGGNVTQITYQWVLNTKGFGGAALRVEDLRLLEPPGGTLIIKSTKRLEGLAPPTDEPRPRPPLSKAHLLSNVRFSIDKSPETGSNHIQEPNETNNSLTKTLDCAELKQPVQPGVIRPKDQG